MRKLSMRLLPVLAIGALALSACGSSGDDSGGGDTGNGNGSVSESSDSGGDTGSSDENTTDESGGDKSGDESSKKVRIALIMKDQSNPYWFFMADAGKEKAKELGIDLQVSAAKDDSDTQSQINAVNAAIADGMDGIVIAINGNAVSSALKRAEDAGITVMAVDTVPTPPGMVDATFGTPNEKAGELIGQYAAAKLDGKDATIALLDAYDDQAVSVDIDRDHGFLKGFGIPVGDPDINGKQPNSGQYTGGKGGNYKIVCQVATNGAQAQGQDAMNTCLTKDPSINVVYTINEQAAQGAIQSIKNLGDIDDIILVSIDGGCSNLQFVASGEEDATAGQRPDLMTQDAIEAIYNKIVKDETPEFDDADQKFISSGTYLITDSPIDGIDSVTTKDAQSTCWGSD